VHRIEWSRPALNDLISAGEYIAKDNPGAAKRMADRVQEAVENLIDNPSIGKPGRLERTREFVVTGTPFIVVYWLKEGTIQILRILHHAQKWP